MPWARLEDKLDWLWRCWAPPVLAANGDWSLEQEALARPGVAAARAEYDRTIQDIRRRAQRPVTPFLDGELA